MIYIIRYKLINEILFIFYLYSNDYHLWWWGQGDRLVEWFGVGIKWGGCNIIYKYIYKYKWFSTQFKLLVDLLVFFFSRWCKKKQLEYNLLFWPDHSYKVSKNCWRETYWWRRKSLWRWRWRWVVSGGDNELIVTETKG